MRLAVLTVATMIVLAPTANAQPPQQVDVGDQTATAQLRSISGNGRFALMTVRSDSNLVPAAHRTQSAQGDFLVRKDMQTGGTIVAGVRVFRTAVPVWHPSVTMAENGTTFAYASREGNDPVVLYTRDLSTDQVRAVHTFPTDTQPLDMKLSSDGRWLSWRTGQHLQRHDLSIGRTSTVVNCDTGGCEMSKSQMSADGTKFTFLYRATPNDPIRLYFGSMTTGELRALPEAELHDGYVLSGDGNWVVYTQSFHCPTCDGGTFLLKKVGTAPDSTPVTLRTWKDNITWALGPTSVSHDARVIGYFRQTGEPGPWYGAAPGYLHDQATGEETRLPDVRDTAYAGAPVISADASKVAFREFCLSGQNCYPTGTYLLSVS